MPLCQRCQVFVRGASARFTTPSLQAARATSCGGGNFSSAGENDSQPFLESPGVARALQISTWRLILSVETLCPLFSLLRAVVNFSPPSYCACISVPWLLFHFCNPSFKFFQFHPFIQIDIYIQFACQSFFFEFFSLLLDPSILFSTVGYIVFNFVLHFKFIIYCTLISVPLLLNFFPFKSLNIFGTKV